MRSTKRCSLAKLYSNRDLACLIMMLLSGMEKKVLRNEAWGIKLTAVSRYTVGERPRSRRSGIVPACSLLLLMVVDAYDAFFF